MTGILVLDFWTVSTSLRDWDKALTIIDPYEGRDDVDDDARVGRIKMYSITEEEARSLLESLKDIRGFHIAWFFEDYDAYILETPTWEVRA